MNGGVLKELLNGLNATGVMRTIKGEERQPVPPELAVSVTPLMVAISGKTPISDALDEATLANPLARQWRLAFHTNLNIAGNQSSLCIPQVVALLWSVHHILC